MKQYGIVMVSTTELIVTVLAFLWAGRWADNHYGLGQKGIITGAVVGFILGFVRFVMRLQAMNKEDDKNSPPPQNPI